MNRLIKKHKLKLVLLVCHLTFLVCNLKCAWYKNGSVFAKI